MSLTLFLWTALVAFALSAVSQFASVVTGVRPESSRLTLAFDTLFCLIMAFWAAALLTR